MTAVNKKALAKAIAAQHHITQKAALESVDQVFDAVINSLKNGDEVDISGFGKFSLKRRAAREGMNPRSKEKVQVPASCTVKFTVKKSFRDELTRNVNAAPHSDSPDSDQ